MRRQQDAFCWRTGYRKRRRPFRNAEEARRRSRQCRERCRELVRKDPQGAAYGARRRKRWGVQLVDTWRDKEFQFTRPREARLCCQVCRQVVRQVSIHAPARGATLTAENFSVVVTFQFTRPRGARQIPADVVDAADEFQFTRPRGARRSASSGSSRTCSFNSRAREGRDAFNMLLEDLEWVSIHEPARGATKDARILFRPKAGFNSRAREGRDAIPAPDLSPYATFQFTRPRGARPYGHGGPPLFLAFQFTRPRGARHNLSATKASSRGFNSRAREGRDDRGERGPGGEDVSIHAPARGATAVARPRARLGRFQFTRPRGARPSSWDGAATCSRFNSRAREGRDPPGLPDFRRLAVSIHAPARGATASSPRRARSPTRFNSRAREGRDAAHGGRAGGAAGFNSRAREGRDFPSNRPPSKCQSFNSRAREGRDRGRSTRPCFGSCFNSRARKGRDLFGSPPGGTQSVSIHAPARGATAAWMALLTLANEVSIHTPARGATACPPSPAPPPASFNSHARKGRD